jgi:hypothetical protein
VCVVAACPLVAFRSDAPAAARKLLSPYPPFAAARSICTYAF